MRIALSKSSFNPLRLIQLRLILISIVATVSALGFLCSLANGQELRKAIRDYRDERIFNYQPNDPQYRGKAFNVHTKHYGHFYNCDNQEDKRNSPYIYWRPHYENDFPPRIGFCENLRRDIIEIKQRISDGASGCRGSCACQQCQSVSHQVPHHQVSPCVQCAVSSNLSSDSIASSNHVDQSSATNQTKPRSSLVENSGERKYGLLSGKIFQPTALPQTDSIGLRESKQAEIVSRLPPEDLNQEASYSKSWSAVATHSKNPKVLSSSSSSQVKPPQIKPSQIKPPSSNTPRVVKHPEFWNRYK